jgi:cytochrome c oxidase subunit II
MDQITGSYGYWLPMDISAHGAPIDRLMAILHWFMLLLFVGWGIFYVYCLVKFRARAGHVASYAPVKAIFTKYIEVAVVVVEVFLLFGLSTPVWFKYKGEPGAASNRMRLVAEQFAWDFHYPGKDGKFGRTDASLISSENPVGLDLEDPAAKDDIVNVNQMHVLLNKPTVVEITAKDVIHSFNIPVLRVKQDAIPGQRVPVFFEATQTGHFELACAQLCGLGHFKMRADVLVDSPADYAKWESENAPAPAEAAAPAADQKKPAATPETPKPPLKGQAEKTAP